MAISQIFTSSDLSVSDTAADSSVIKSLQTGVFTATSYIASIAINTVDVQKSMVIVHSHFSSNSTTTRNFIPYVLTPNSLVLQNDAPDSILLHWQVIEFK